jgi:uncharacterized protein (TIGR02996 family)
MNDITPFLQDIAANPHDDAPRLVLADWIEENGEALRPLGEFIRVQYALEGMHPGNPRRPGLLKLQQALLPAQLERWKDALACLPGVKPSFRRGFVEQLRGTPQALAPLSEGQTFGLPVRSLTVEHYEAHYDPAQQRKIDSALRAVASRPILEQVEELDLSAVVFPGREAADGWMRSSRLGRLRSLVLPRSPVALEAFLAGPLHRQVRSLGICEYPPYNWCFRQGSEPDWSGAARLAVSRPLPAVGALTVCVGFLANRGFTNLLGALQLPGLARLSFQPDSEARPDTRPRFDLLPPSLLARVREVGLTGVPPSALSGLRDVPRLESLSLSSCGLTTETIPLLADMPAPLLWSLDLSTNRFGNEGARAVAALPLLREVRSFRASYCVIGPDGAVALCRSLPAGLTALDLSWNPIRGEGLSRLRADSLQALDASYCELGDDAALTIAGWPAGKLNSLSLASNRLTDRGAAALLASPALANLEALDLSTNSLTDATVEQMLTSPLVRQLRLVFLFGNSITSEALARLRKAVRGVVA